MRATQTQTVLQKEENFMSEIILKRLEMKQTVSWCFCITLKYSCEFVILCPFLTADSPKDLDKRIKDKTKSEHHPCEKKRFFLSLEK